jgi:ATP-dependent DNA ligase
VSHATKYVCKEKLTIVHRIGPLQWVHEIKHDGYRLIARRTGDRVRLYSRPGNDLTYRFPLIVR